jgi:hypothetical protein
MGWKEVERFEGVGRGVMGFIRMWKYVEKLNKPTRKSDVWASCQLRLDVAARLSEGSTSQVSNVSKDLFAEEGRQPFRGKEKRSTDQSQKPTTKTAYEAPGDMVGLEVSPIPCTLQT